MLAEAFKNLHLERNIRCRLIKLKHVIVSLTDKVREFSLLSEPFNATPFAAIPISLEHEMKSVFVLVRTFNVEDEFAWFATLFPNLRNSKPWCRTMADLNQTSFFASRKIDKTHVANTNLVPNRIRAIDG